ncbi:hypothetical protein TeGR_g10754 [Tetraparma gracilis]|uniref:Uncharacterized protein n=1 Tax=Tetraparma gracilis TaxID=2962635 RepID=A0ABQ6MI35_9STRA|nr:hypothetical protein TeGR_g10754 [Tetraparma gracilis]
MRFAGEGDRSLRCVLAMLDGETAAALAAVRGVILKPLAASADASTPGAWIPACNVVPAAQLHVTVAVPWWWHPRPAGGGGVSARMAVRLRQTLLLKRHCKIQIEVDRVLLMGSTLVCLWRTVGPRGCDGPGEVVDRDGDGPDPFVRLRSEIIRCFATLARLPLSVLCADSVDLRPIHRLCREATAKMSGRRMVIGRYRLLETTGEGGESNPCVEPVFAYRPCPNFVARGGLYERAGQSLDEIAFARRDEDT